MKFNVLAQSFNRENGEPVSNPRVEEIDTKTNFLFYNCTLPLSIKIAYERFWNELNPNSENVVFVQSINKIK